MTVGRQQYNEADLLRMQRDAESRVRDMQRRARETIEVEPDAEPRQRGWSQRVGQNHSAYRPSPGVAARRPPPPRQEAPPPAPEAPPDAGSATGKSGTILGDIMGALRLDEDYLLIIGLILILLNQKGDPVLILALAYLLI